MRFAASASGLPVRLDVWDACGRLVRTLRKASVKGADGLAWNGRSDDGTPVPAGVYFARLTVGSRVSPGRLVRVR